MVTEVTATTRSGAAFLSEAVRRHRTSFLTLGLVMVALGLVAIALPFAATLAVEVFLGVILLLRGALEVFHAFRAADWKGFAWSLAGGVLALAVGLLLLFYPLTGMLTLTLLVAAFFLIGGVARVILATQLRPMDHWGWMLVSGILALLLAGLILWQLPEAAGWVVGLLVGIDLVFAGVTFALLGATARRAA